MTAHEMGKPCTPITRATALAIVRNPFAGLDQEDLSFLFDAAAQLGETLAQELVHMLSAPPMRYGKATLIGSSGAMEHGAALLHPKLGEPVRKAVDGGMNRAPFAGSSNS